MVQSDGGSPQKVLLWCSNGCKTLWSKLLEADSKLHERLYSKFPKGVRFGGTILRAVYAIFISPAFAVVLALLLVPFVISGVIPVIVSICVFAAWLVSTLSVARIEAINQLRIGRRLLLVIAASIVMAAVGNRYIKWVLINYSKTSEPRTASGVDIDKLAYNRFKELFDAEIEKYQGLSSKNLQSPSQPPTIVRPPKADLALEFAGTKDLQLLLADTTSTPARDPKHWFAVVDLTNMYVWPGKPGDFQPLPLQTETFANDYVRGNDRVGPYSVLDESPPGTARAHVKEGDILVGQISATCINCIRVRRYYLYFKMGTGGWYWPIPESKKTVQVPVPKVSSATEEEINAFLDKMVPKDARLAIPESFDYNRPTKRLP